MLLKLTVILHLQQAVAAKSFHLPSEQVSRGNVSEALKTAQHVLEGRMHIGGQEHFYLETQACLVVPTGEDGEMEIFSSTQHPASIQVNGFSRWLNLYAGPKTSCRHGPGATIGGEGIYFRVVRPSVRSPLLRVTQYLRS